MTTYVGDNRTAYNVTVPKTQVPPGDFVGKLKCSYDEFTLSTSVLYSIGDLIELGNIPAGARIHDVVCIAEDMGATGILEVGTLTDPDRYLEVVDAGGQDGGQKMSSLIFTGGAKPVGAFEKLTVDTVIYARFTEASANPATNAAKIQLAVYYSMD